MKKQPSQPLERTKEFAMKHAGHLAALVLAGLALSPARAAEGYQIWDNFDGATAISAGRWQGTERPRLIEGATLHVVQRDVGSQSSNSGLFSNTWASNVPNPTPITQMRALVTVNAFDVTGCAANATPSSAVARLSGGFFNAGPGVPTSRINDVGANIRLERLSNSSDGPTQLHVTGTVFQCTTSDCNYDSVSLGSADLGTAALGETVTLKMEWEPQSKRFNFYRGSNPVVRVTNTGKDAQPPYVAYRQIGTRTSVANCLAGNRTEAFIDANFDNFSVNKSAVP